MPESHVSCQFSPFFLYSSTRLIDAMGLSGLCRNIIQRRKDMMDERKVTNLLANKLKNSPNIDKIYTHKNLASSSIFRKKWSDYYGDNAPPLQPEIDMVIIKGGKLVAVEVKYFRLEKKRIKPSFYRGIDQSLALLALGFDHVALWHIFDTKIPEEKIESFGLRTWQYVKRIIDVPIEYSAIRMRKDKRILNFSSYYTIDYIENNEVVLTLNQETLPIDDMEFKFRYTKNNPFLKIKDNRMNRKMVCLSPLTKLQDYR